MVSIRFALVGSLSYMAPYWFNCSGGDVMGSKCTGIPSPDLLRASIRVSGGPHISDFNSTGSASSSSHPRLLVIGIDLYKRLRWNEHR